MTHIQEKYLQRESHPEMRFWNMIRQPRCGTLGLLLSLDNLHTQWRMLFHLVSLRVIVPEPQSAVGVTGYKLAKCFCR